MSISYALNPTVFNAQVYPQLGGAVTIENVTLDCGNGQTLDIDTRTLVFN